MNIGQCCVITMYVLGIIHLFFGCFDSDPVEKARFFAYAAAMFGAASAIGVLWLMGASPSTTRAPK